MSCRSLAVFDRRRDQKSVHTAEKVQWMCMGGDRGWGSYVLFCPSVRISRGGHREHDRIRQCAVGCKYKPLSKQRTGSVYDHNRLKINYVCIFYYALDVIDVVDWMLESAVNWTIMSLLLELCTRLTILDLCSLYRHIHASRPNETRVEQHCKQYAFRLHSYIFASHEFFFGF